MDLSRTHVGTSHNDGHTDFRLSQSKPVRLWARKVYDLSVVHHSKKIKFNKIP